MKPRNLLILTAVVAILGAFIFFYEKDLPTTDERAEQAKKVLTLDADEVRAVTIERDGGRVRLERDLPPAADEEAEEETDAPAAAASEDREWRLTEPLAARAERWTVDGLVRTLVGLEKSRTLEEVDRADVGLETPRATVTLSTADGETVLEVGAEIPGSDDMIVAVRGRPEVYQVSRSSWTDLSRDPGDWRDKKLFPATRADVDRVTLSPGQVLLAKRGDDFWVESPLTDRADEDRVNALLTEITGLSATAFIDEPPESLAELGLEPPAAVCEVVLAGREEPFRLELGRVAEEPGEGSEEEEDLAVDGGETYYGHAGDQLFEIKTRLAESLALAPAEWRARSWTGLQVFKIESARLEDGDGAVEVTRDGSDWRRGEERVGYSVVSDVLYAITDVKAEEVVSREEAAERGHPCADPALRITLTTEESSEELALHPVVGELAAATTDDRDAVLLVAATAVDEITRKLRDLRSAEPIAEQPEAGEAEAVDD